MYTALQKELNVSKDQWCLKKAYNFVLECIYKFIYLWQRVIQMLHALVDEKMDSLMII